MPFKSLIDRQNYAKRWRISHPGYFTQHLKQWKENNPEYFKEYSKKYYPKTKQTGATQAKSAVLYAIRTKKIPSLRENLVLCVDCGNRANIYEHRDYNKPLIVEPVCRSCNRIRGRAVYLEN